MSSNKVILSVCCAVVLALSGCSRQQSDWQKARERNTAESYEQYLKKYPSGEFTAQAEARVKELYEEHDWQKARDLDTAEAYQAFLKQYPEGKWTEEARIRVENFTLAQAPSGAAAAPAAAAVEPGGTVPPPAPAPAPAPSAPTSPPSRAATRTAPGAYAVQLGAFKSGAAAAHQHWAKLKKEYPKVLAGLSSTVSPRKTNSGSLYRLQAIGLTERHARAICGSLAARSEACIVVPAAEG